MKKLISISVTLVTLFLTFVLSLSAQNTEIRFCSVKQNATPNANKINKDLGEKHYVVKNYDIINVVMEPALKSNLPSCRLKVGEIVVLDSEGKIIRVLNCGNTVIRYFWYKEKSSDVIDGNKEKSSDVIDLKKKKKIIRSKNTTINNGSNGSGAGEGCTSGIRLQDYNNNPVNGGDFGSLPAVDFKKYGRNGGYKNITMDNGTASYHKGWLWVGVPVSVFATYLIIDKVSDGKLDWNFRIEDGGGDGGDWPPKVLPPVKPLEPNH